ncbi:glycosyl hydrolase catalytic core-domain-containing protein [Schizophyllum commune]
MYTNTTITRLALLILIFILSVGRARAQNNSTKAGLAWPNGRYDDARQFTKTGKVSWYVYYTWSPSPVRGLDLEFVPMYWGERQTEQFSGSINDTIDAYDVKHVLAFNEPQQEGQADINVTRALELWTDYLLPLRDAYGVKLGSPAPTSAPDGMTWLQDFCNAIDEARGSDGCPEVDFIALHWYDVDADNFKTYMEDFHDAFPGKSIWVTEWACQNFNSGAQCSYADIITFMNETQSWMDETDWIERYAWFGAMRDLQGVNADNALLDKDGDLTDLGQQYIGEDPADPNNDSSAQALFPVALYTLAAAWLCQVAVA